MQVLIDAERIHRRVDELGLRIRADLGDAPITCIGVLKGSFVFMADLVRAIGGDVRCEFLGASSYEGTTSTGAVRLTADLTRPLEGQECLLVEDIVDTGRTVAHLRHHLSEARPRSLRVAALLDKPSRRQVETKLDYVGFTVQDVFVVGYGMDHEERYRNLPYVGCLPDRPLLTR